MADPTGSDNKVILEVEFDTSKAAEAARKRAEAEQKADEARWSRMAREDAKAEERQKQRQQREEESQQRATAKAMETARKRADAEQKADERRWSGMAREDAKAEIRDKERQRRAEESQKKAEERDAAATKARIDAMIRADVLAEDRHRKRLAAEDDAQKKKDAADKKKEAETQKADEARWNRMAAADAASEQRFKRAEALKATRGGMSAADVAKNFGTDAAQHATDQAAEMKSNAAASRKEALQAKYGSGVGGFISSLTSGTVGAIMGAVSGPLLALTAGAKFIGHVADSINSGTEASILAGGSSNANLRGAAKNFFLTAPIVGISDSITGRAFKIRANQRLNEEDMAYAEQRQAGISDRYRVFRQVATQEGRSAAAGVAYQGPRNASFNRDSATGERAYQDEMIRAPLREQTTAAVKSAAAAAQNLTLQERQLDAMMKSEATQRQIFETAKKNYDAVKDAGGPKAHMAANDVALARANLTAWEDRTRQAKEDTNSARQQAINAQFGVKSAKLNSDSDLGVLQNRLEQANRGTQTFARANVGERMQAIQAIQMAQQYGTDMVPPELRAIGEQFAPNTFNKLYENQVKGNPGLRQLQDIAPADFRPGDTPQDLRRQIDETIDKVRAEQQALDKQKEDQILNMVKELDKISRESTQKQIDRALQGLRQARAVGAHAD